MCEKRSWESFLMNPIGLERELQLGVKFIEVIWPTVFSKKKINAKNEICEDFKLKQKSSMPTIRLLVLIPISQIS